MPSNHTQNYQLSQWSADDQVCRTDFNADNAKIDAALAEEKAARTAGDTALQTTLNARIDAAFQGLSSGKADKSALDAVDAKISRIVTGSYVGTGGSGGVRRITLPGRPKVVVIRSEHPGTSHYYKAVILTEVCTFMVHTYSSLSAQVPGSGYTLEDNGFTVPSGSDQNYADAAQHYLAVI